MITNDHEETHICRVIIMEITSKIENFSITFYGLWWTGQIIYSYYTSVLRRVWRYQRGNQNPYIEEEQTKHICRVIIMVFNATFNNIAVTSWLSVLLVYTMWHRTLKYTNNNWLSPMVSLWVAFWYSNVICRMVQWNMYTPIKLTATT
jgi:hypothetical protein